MNKLNPPIAPQINHLTQTPFETLSDPYFWLKNKDHPATLKYLKAENSYFNDYLKPVAPLQKQLIKEMRSQINETDQSVPVTKGPYQYWTQWLRGRQYPIFKRKSLITKKTEIILDQNLLAKGKKYCAITNTTLCPKGEILAFGVDFDGSERFQLKLFHLPTKKWLKDELSNLADGVLFSADSRYLFYITLDDNHRPFQVYRHQLGQPQSSDCLIYEEKGQHFVSLSKARSGNFIFINCADKTTCETWIVDAHNPTRDITCFNPRKDNLEYYVDHFNDQFWIQTNAEAKNFKLMTCKIDQTNINTWQDLWPERETIYLQSFVIFESFLAISILNKGQSDIEILDYKKKKSHLLKFKDPAYEVNFSTSENPNPHSQSLRLHYSSPINPGEVLEYNVLSKSSKKLKIKKIKGHNPKNYLCKKIWVTGHDSTRIPLVITYHKKLKLKGKNPTYLYGYGSYGLSMPDRYPERRHLFRLIDRGYIYALAHIRGGSELGHQWYEDGKFLKKQNTFLDFIACADYLKNNGYTHPEKLAICGGSAGGLLMGACMNMHPKLFNLVVAHVPFVDVLNTMLDDTLPLTQLEYKEWGNPSEKLYYDYIKSYSPYDNVTAQEYPKLMVTCGLNDFRVTYWEPAKWVAKLRELKKDDHPIIFKTNMGAGHFSYTGRFDYLAEIAEEYAFIISEFK